MIWRLWIAVSTPRVTDLVGLRIWIFNKMMVWVPHFEKPNLGCIGHLQALALASKWSWYVCPSYPFYILHSVTGLFVDCPSQLSAGSLVLLSVPPGSERKEQLSGRFRLGKSSVPQTLIPILHATRYTSPFFFLTSLTLYVCLGLSPEPG